MAGWRVYPGWCTGWCIYQVLYALWVYTTWYIPPGYTTLGTPAHPREGPPGGTHSRARRASQPASSERIRPPREGTLALPPAGTSLRAAGRWSGRAALGLWPRTFGGRPWAYGPGPSEGGPGPMAQDLRRARKAGFLRSRPRTAKKPATESTLAQGDPKGTRARTRVCRLPQGPEPPFNAARAGQPGGPARRPAHSLARGSGGAFRHLTGEASDARGVSRACARARRAAGGCTTLRRSL